MAHPDWAVKYRRPGTELRCIHGRYCLYECSSVYDKEKKRSVKKTGRYFSGAALKIEEKFWSNLYSLAESGCP